MIVADVQNVQTPRFHDLVLVAKFRVTNSRCGAPLERLAGGTPVKLKGAAAKKPKRQGRGPSNSPRKSVLPMLPGGEEASEDPHAARRRAEGAIQAAAPAHELTPPIPLMK